MKTISKTRQVLLAATALLVAGALVLGTLQTRGFWDESKAVHIKADEIENSTLAIGTHLIHLSALTDAIYEIAEKSAEESGQSRIYYKSELGGGAWFDITSASSLEDITTGGMPITDEEMEDLFFTYHTKSDKITYDLRTGEAVNIFDIRDPYDLENMEEMSPLKMYYDQLVELDGDEKIIAEIEEFWETPVSGAEAPKEIAEQEENLSALQAYLKVLQENDADAQEIEKVNAVMEAVDAARRYYVFTVVEPVLQSWLNERGGTAPEGEEDSEEEEESVEVEDPELLSALSETLGNTEASLITYGGKMLSEGITVVSTAEYEFSTSLIGHAKANNHAACDRDVQNLLDLDNIQNNVISNRQRELALLENPLLPKATSEYQKAIGRGESAEYQAAVAKNSAQALLNRFISENEGEVETRRGELEYLINAKTSRISAQDALAFTDERLELTRDSFMSGIPNDAFAETSTASVEEHITFLTNLRRTLELALGGNELDQLIAEKEDLQTQRLEALDNNDLAGAEKLQQQITALEEKIRSMEEENAARVASLKDRINGLEEGSSERNDLEAELALLESSLSDGTLGAAVAQMKKDGDVEGLAALLPTAPKLVLPALQDLYNDLLLNGGDSDQIKRIEQAILENPNALRDELSAEQIREAMEAWLAEQGTDGGEDGLLTGAGGLSRESAYRIMAAIVGVNLYYEETGNPAAKQVFTALAQEQYHLGNLLFFERIEDSTGKYLPLTAVQTLTGRRYVWEKNSSMGILAYGTDYYGFTLYSDGVKRDRDGLKTESMQRIAKYQNGVHIPAEYALDTFDVHTVYLAEMTLGCICDDPAMELAQELFARLLAE